MQGNITPIMPNIGISIYKGTGENLYVKNQNIFCIRLPKIGATHKIKQLENINIPVQIYKLS